MLKAVLNITNSEFENIIMCGTPDDLIELIDNRTKGLKEEQIKEVCNVLTKAGESNE